MLVWHFLGILFDNEVVSICYGFCLKFVIFCQIYFHIHICVLFFLQSHKLKIFSSCFKCFCDFISKNKNTFKRADFSPPILFTTLFIVFISIVTHFVR